MLGLEIVYTLMVAPSIIVGAWPIWHGSIATYNFLFCYYCH